MGGVGGHVEGFECLRYNLAGVRGGARGRGRDKRGLLGWREDGRVRGSVYMTETLHVNGERRRSRYGLVKKHVFEKGPGGEGAAWGSREEGEENKGGSGGTRVPGLGGGLDRGSDSGGGSDRGSDWVGQRVGLGRTEGRTRVVGRTEGRTI